MTSTLFRGQPSWVLQHPCGDSLQVLQHGAHVVSWRAAGAERLFLSPLSVFDGKAAIRGGVPVCFPQFNQRGVLPKHGFVRNLPWAAEGEPQLVDDTVRFALTLSDSAATRAHWQQAFGVRLTLELAPGALHMALTVHNTDTQPLELTGALHSYWAVDDIATTTLEGLGQQSEWDAVRDVTGTGVSPLRFDGEFDRVYAASPEPLILRSGQQALELRQSSTWAQTVVWNPGAALAAKMPDLGPGGHARMLCVEAAQVYEPVRLSAGAQWTAWQSARLL